MSEAPITTAEVDGYKTFIGRSLTERDVVSAHMAAHMAATLDRPPPDNELPAMWHYGLFLNSVPTSKLGPDGHPSRGEFMPPVSLSRRMFAGAALKFYRPLRIGQEVIRTLRIASVEHWRGKTGDPGVRSRADHYRAGEHYLHRGRTDHRVSRRRAGRRRGLSRSRRAGAADGDAAV